MSNRSQDSAPDIYETPELTDDASTVPVSLGVDFLAWVVKAHARTRRQLLEANRTTNSTMSTTMRQAYRGQDYGSRKLDRGSCRHKSMRRRPTSPTELTANEMHTGRQADVHAS